MRAAIGVLCVSTRQPRAESCVRAAAGVPGAAKHRVLLRMRCSAAWLASAVFTQVTMASRVTHGMGGEGVPV